MHAVVKIITGIVVFAALFVPAQSFAFSIDYPAIPAPVPGGYFDLNCIDVFWNDLSGCYSSYIPDPSISNIIFFLFISAIWVGGIVALISLLYTGVQFILAGSDAQVRLAAKDRLQKVMWGIAILLSTVVILNIINPDITNLRDPLLQGADKGTISNLKIPEPEAITGVFSCGWNEDEEKCEVAEDNCQSGYVPDLRWCYLVRHSECIDARTSKDVPCIPPPPECWDLEDNDNDGFVDYPEDPQCESRDDDTESAPQCSDGIDNDDDTFIDYPVDGGCESPDDDDETNAPVLSCYNKCIELGGAPGVCRFECGMTFSCDPFLSGYATCLKQEFNVVVTGTSNSNFIKKVWDAMYQATTSGGPGYRTNLIYGGNILYVRYAPTSSDPSYCFGYASDANTILFKTLGCLTLTNPAIVGLVQHESGHIITGRNPRLSTQFTSALSGLATLDPDCYQRDSSSCFPSYSDRHFVKTYALRYYCPSYGGSSCITKIRAFSESFAEGMANYLYTNRGGRFLCSQNISSIPTQCDDTNRWMNTNVYNP
ncbi:MAG: hypothetical protein WD712_01165 [Candidatus Spechtbacterales bacterium]